MLQVGSRNLRVDEIDHLAAGGLAYECPGQGKGSPRIYRQIMDQRRVSHLIEGLRVKLRRTVDEDLDRTRFCPGPVDQRIRFLGQIKISLHRERLDPAGDQRLAQALGWCRRVAVTDGQRYPLFRPPERDPPPRAPPPPRPQRRLVLLG